MQELDSSGPDHIANLTIIQTNESSFVYFCLSFQISDTAPIVNFLLFSVHALAFQNFVFSILPQTLQQGSLKMG